MQVLSRVLVPTLQGSLGTDWLSGLHHASPTLPPGADLLHHRPPSSDLLGALGAALAPPGAGLSRSRPLGLPHDGAHLLPIP